MPAPTQSLSLSHGNMNSGMNAETLEHYWLMLSKQHCPISCNVYLQHWNETMMKHQTKNYRKAGSNFLWTRMVQTNISLYRSHFLFNKLSLRINKRSSFLWCLHSRNLEQFHRLSETTFVVTVKNSEIENVSDKKKWKWDFQQKQFSCFFPLSTQTWFTISL